MNIDDVRIMKFGGSSVGTAERMRRVAGIVKEYSDTPQVIVASAVGGVTDRLVETHRLARKEDAAYHMIVQAIADQHIEIATSISRRNSAQSVERIEVLIHELSTVLEQVARDTNEKRSYDAVVSFGERLSVELLAAIMREEGDRAQAVNAATIIRTNDEFSDAQPILEATEQNARAQLLPLLRQGITPIVTGFIGATEAGNVTTLGRGASDYTATILGYCLDVSEVIIWTDVTGVMTADPRVIPDARTIADLSYNEASELSYYGAKVLHPLTMVPASLKNIPIRIKNTFRPDAAGTRIASYAEQSNQNIKAVTTKSGLCIVSIYSKDHDGVPSTIADAMSLIVEHKVPVYLMTQASYEGNVSFVVQAAVVGTLVDALEKRFADSNVTIKIEDDMSIVAAVGAGDHVVSMAMGVIFSSLLASGVKSKAVAQGSSDKSVSILVRTQDELTAVRSLHQGLALKSMNEQKDEAL